MAHTENSIFDSNHQHYYQVTNANHQSWADAVNNAIELGGYLVSIDDETESILLQQSLNSEDEYWVGGDEGSVFGAVAGDSYIASPSDDLSLPGIVEYDSAFDYYTSADYLDSAISTLLPDSLNYLWDTVSIKQPADDRYELSWQDEINLTELFDVSDLLPNVDVGVKNPTFTITEADSGNSYGFAGDISVGEQDFKIDTSFTLENIEGVSNFSWDNIALPSVSLSNLTSLLGDAVSGLDRFSGDGDTINIDISEDGANLAWNGNIDLTGLLNLDGFLPELSVDNPTLAIALEEGTTTYDVAGGITIGDEPSFKVSSSFVQETLNDGSSEFSFQEIAINDLSLNSVTNLLGNTISGFNSFAGNTSTEGDALNTIDITINPNSTELIWDGNIDLEMPFNLDNIFPALTIETPKFKIATEEDNTKTYELAANISVGNSTPIPMGASFTSADINGVSNFSWDKITIPEVSLGNVTSLLGDAVSGLDRFFDPNDTIDIDISDTGAKLAWGGDINLNLGDSLPGSFLSSFPSLTVATPTFAIALGDDTTTYEFAGGIQLGNLEPFDFSSSFIQEEVNESSEFSWSEIKIAEFDLDNITGLLGDSFSAVGNFFDNNLDLPEVTVGITPDAVMLTLEENIDVNDLVGLNNLIPGVNLGFNLDIANPSVEIAKKEGITTYRVEGTVNGTKLSTSFTESAVGGLDFQEFSIPDFSLSTLTSKIGKGLNQVSDVFGDAIPEIDVTIAKNELGDFTLGFGSALDFASSSNDYLQWIHKKLDIDTLDVDFTYANGSISLDAGVEGEFELVSTKDLDAFLTGVNLSFDADYGGSSVATSLSLEAGARLDIKDSDRTSLDLRGDISFEVGTGGFEAEGSFALNAGEDGWDNPFGLPDSNIREFGLSLGLGGVTGLDSFGIRGALQFGGYNFDAAFSIDLTNPDEFALAATLNKPITVVDLLAGPAASYALGYAAKNVGFINNAKNIMNQVLDVQVVSTDTDGEPGLEPLIYIVPEDTEIAGKLYEQGFSVNAAVSAWGKDASLYFNANAETGEISGGLDIDKINIDVGDTTILKIEGSDFADDNGKGTIVGGTVTEADKYIDRGNSDGTLVGYETVSGEGNDGTLVGNATVSEEANHGTLIDGTIADGVLKLDGVNDDVKVASASELSLTDGTIEFRVTPDWAPGEKNFNPTVLANRDTTGTNYSIHIRRNLDGIDLWNGSQVRTVAYNFQQGVEYHVALVESGTNTEVFINGVSQGIMNRGFSGRQGLDFYIGSADGTRAFFEGTIDDVRIWSTVRSADEISNNYQNTLSGDEAGLVAYWNFEEESVAGNTVKDVTAKSVLNLDGSGDYVKVANSSELSLTDGTIEFKVKPDWAPGEKNFNPAVLANRDTTGTNYSIHMRRNLDGIGFWNGSQVRNVFYNFQQGVEYHVALVESGSNIEVFINGVSQGTMDRGFSGRQGLDFHIGSSDGTREFFEGTIDDVRIWSTVRSATEIGDNYQNSLTGEEAGLVAYWNFDNGSVEGNTVRDVAKTEIEFANSASDGVLQLDGTDDYVNVSSDRLLNLSENSTFTLEAWINPDHDDNGYHGFIGSHGNGAKQRTPGMWVVNQTGIHHGFGDGRSWNSKRVDNVLTPNSWSHVASTFDGTTYTLYVNGEAVHSTDDFAGKTPYASDQLAIGRVAGTGSYFQGEMDEVRVWDIARSADEISDNYQTSLTGEEAGLVAYWNFDNGSVEGNTVKDVAQTEIEFANSAPDGVLQLDGTDDYVNVSSDRTLDLSINKTFTLEAWINPYHDDYSFQGVIGSQGNGLHERTPGMWVVGQGIHFGFGDGSSWDARTVNNVLTPDSWNHVANTFDGRTYTLYVNGENVYSTDAFAGKTPYSSDSLTIGQAAGFHFEGEMDEVRVWNIARSASQIETYFQQPLTGEERGLVGYWNFDGDSVNGNKVKDLAAGDDNLNLDFKLSDIDSYLRGDGKITFLGESIDVYVEAGSSGLEFAMATDNGTLSTDLAVVLNKSGFAASGGVDLDLTVDIDLPFGLGKISLVNLEVDTDASISFDGKEFASYFNGSVNINGESIRFSIGINAAFSVEDLYEKLEAKIVQEIKDSVKKVFSDVSEWANAIADGTVEFTGDVANVAVAAYDATAEDTIAAYKTVGKSAEDAINKVKSTFDTDTYKIGIDDMAKWLSKAGYNDATAISKILKSSYKADVRELGRALSGAYTSLSNNDLANILEDNDFNLDSVGRFFKKDLGLSKSNAKSALKSAFKNGRVNDWMKKVWDKINIFD